MVSIIFYDNNSNGDNSSNLISFAASAGHDIVIVGSHKPQHVSDDSFINSSTGPIHQLMAAASGKAKNSHLLFVDSQLSISNDTFEALVNSASSHSNSISVASFGTGADTISLPPFATEMLVGSITSTSMWPLSVLGVKKSTLESVTMIEADSFKVFMGKLLVEAASHGLGIGSLADEIEVNNAADVMTLSNAEIAKLLEHAVNTYNIEDLFPNHAWESFSEESAAASYHTLAAKFINLNDFASAQQCLSFSDSLEDSPRSQGLKAIISMSQGETLGAVANLVSSLQQYEVRKKNSTEANQHYLSFSPNNLEVINDNLHQGLSALNNRDNASALEHFATAVFNFDSFYGENGIDNIKDRVM